MNWAVTLPAVAPRSTRYGSTELRPAQRIWIDTTTQNGASTSCADKRRRDANESRFRHQHSDDFQDLGMSSEYQLPT